MLPLLLREVVMLRLIVWFLLLAAGTIAGWFVEEGTPRFGIVQMAIAVLLFTLIVFLLAVWPAQWLKRFQGFSRKR